MGIRSCGVLLFIVRSGLQLKSSLSAPSPRSNWPVDRAVGKTAQEASCLGRYLAESRWTVILPLGLYVPIASWDRTLNGRE